MNKFQAFYGWFFQQLMIVYSWKLFVFICNTFDNFISRKIFFHVSQFMKIRLCKRYSITAIYRCRKKIDFDRPKFRRKIKAMNQRWVLLHAPLIEQYIYFPENDRNQKKRHSQPSEISTPSRRLEAFSQALHLHTHSSQVMSHRERWLALSSRGSSVNDAALKGCFPQIYTFWMIRRIFEAFRRALNNL